MFCLQYKIKEPIDFLHDAFIDNIWYYTCMSFIIWRRVTSRITFIKKPINTEFFLQVQKLKSFVYKKKPDLEK